MWSSFWGSEHCRERNHSSLGRWGLTPGATKGPGGQKRPLALGQGPQFSEMDFSGRFLGKAQQLLPTPPKSFCNPETTLSSLTTEQLQQPHQNILWPVSKTAD